MQDSARTGRPTGPASEGPLKPPRNEEPEFNAERDIPTEGDDEPAEVDPDAESVAGEEDPGAALDTTRSSPRR